MEDLSGIQLLNVLKTKPEVIFTTAFDQFALQGYELDVADYLLKPISFERFLKAVEKVQEKILHKNAPSSLIKEGNFNHPPDEYFFIKS